MTEALDLAMRDTTVKERYFLTPAALDAAAEHADPPSRKSRPPRRDNPGDNRAKNSKGEVVSSPSLELVLSYEFQVRKQMVRLMNENHEMTEALDLAMRDTTVKERYFLTPEDVVEVEEAQVVDPPPEREEPRASQIPCGGFTLRVLYLFAGAERKTSVIQCLRQLVKNVGWQLDAKEVDLNRGGHFDLTQSDLQEGILREIADGLYHCVICTPPCSTWSRVRMANLRGPPPLRSKEHLWGYPWVKRRYQVELELGNELVRFSIKVWELVVERPFSKDGYLIFLFGEHPEDLGRVEREEDRLVLFPASIWQIERIRKLVDSPSSNVFTIAINQCCWGAPWRKPTRLLSTSKDVAQWGPNVWPQFDAQGSYLGPLVKDGCNCDVKISLAKRSNDESFRTTGTDVYPPRLDEGIAQAVIQHITAQKNSPAHVSEDGDNTQAEEQGEQEPMVEDDHGMIQEEEGPGEGNSSGTREERPGFGLPIRCYYKGRFRTIHDGGGLTSPGRWPVKQRKQMRAKRGIAVAARMEMDKLLTEMGLDPKRRQGDRDTEVNFRRLEAMLRSTEDVDYTWLAEAAREGVALGVDEDLPRVDKVFEEKQKWNLSFTDEDFRDVTADNYKSAEDNSADIRRQVLEEVELGSIVRMRTKEAQAKYEGRLAVAALGAVPKELGSSVV
eukprot:s382_g22.t1